MKSKWVAIFLAIFLGGVGIHKFYLGKWFQGTVYLLLFIFPVIPFLTVVLSILDAISYAVAFNPGTEANHEINRPKV